MNFAVTNLIFRGDEEVEITHCGPVLTEANDLGGAMRRAKAEAEEKDKHERLKRE